VNFLPLAFGIDDLYGRKIELEMLEKSVER
jgi:hypothetical protein